MEDALIEIRHSNPGEANGFSTEKINLDIREDMHGGGDLRLVDDFVKFMKGKNPSISCTNLKDSIYGHLIGFAAIDAMRDRKIVEISI